MDAAGNVILKGKSVTERKNAASRAAGLDTLRTLPVIIGVLGGCTASASASVNSILRGFGEIPSMPSYREFSNNARRISPSLTTSRPAAIWRATRSPSTSSARAFSCSSFSRRSGSTKFVICVSLSPNSSSNSARNLGGLRRLPTVSARAGWRGVRDEEGSRWVSISTIGPSPSNSSVLSVIIADPGASVWSFGGGSAAVPGRSRRRRRSLRMVVDTLRKPW